jgi:hypothetical protein
MYKNILKFVEIKFKIDLNYSTHICQNSHYQGYQESLGGMMEILGKDYLLFFLLKKF